MQLERGHGTAIELADLVPALPRFPSASPAQEAVEVFGYVFLASGWRDAEQIEAIESYRDNAADPQRKAIYSLALAVVFRGAEMRRNLETAVLLATDPATRRTARAELALLNRVGRFGYRLVRRYRTGGEWYSRASRRPSPAPEAELPAPMRTGRYLADDERRPQLAHERTGDRPS